MLGRGLIAIGAIALIVPRKIATIRDAAPLIVDQMAVIGLCILAIIAWEALLSLLARREDKYYRTTILFGFLCGMLAGVVGDMIYQPTEAPDVENGRLLRSLRIAIASGFIGAAIHLVMQTVLGFRRSVALSAVEKFVAAGFLSILVFLIGVWVLTDIPGFGGNVRAWTGGLIDWIGEGACFGPPPPEQACHLKGRPDLIALAGTILVIYGVFIALYYIVRLKLSRVPAICCVGGVAIAGLLMIWGLGFGGLTRPSGATQAMSTGQVVVLIAIMTAYIVVFSWFLLWSRKRALVEGLYDAYESADDFRAMLRARLAAQVGIVPGYAQKKDLIDAVVRRADHDGWLDQLIVNARFSRPNAVKLAKLADSLGLGVAPPGEANLRATAKQIDDLQVTGREAPEQLFEKIVNKKSELANPIDWRTSLASLEPRVCRVETPTGEFGTGFLVWPDLVMTNHHVVQEFCTEKDAGRACDIACRFDYKTGAGGRTVSVGTVYKLHPNRPIVAWSPPSKADLQNSDDKLPQPGELDFALLRLAKPAGEEAIGGTGEAKAPRRGWVSLAPAAAKPDLAPEDADEILVILQHPSAGPLKQDIGKVTEINGNGTRVRHMANTLPGSSGSPCFSIRDFTLFALHHAGGHSRRLNLDFNQAVPLGRIVQHIRQEARHVEPVWDKEPPASV